MSQPSREHESPPSRPFSRILCPFALSNFLSSLAQSLSLSTLLSPVLVCSRSSFTRALWILFCFSANIYRNQKGITIPVLKRSQWIELNSHHAQWNNNPLCLNTRMKKEAGVFSGFCCWWGWWHQGDEAIRAQNAISSVFFTKWIICIKKWNLLSSKEV